MSRVHRIEIYSFTVKAYPVAIPQTVENQSYIMYHGTTRQNAKIILENGFRQSEDGMLGPGVYLSRDLKKASRYPINHPEWDRVVIKVKVNVGRVIAIRYNNHPMQKTWRFHGYDTAWVPPNCGMVPSGQEEDCVWDPRRIKILQLIYPSPAGASRLLTPQPNDGQTYIMYHGTTREKAQAISVTGFHQSPNGMLGRGVYLSRDLEKASRYPIDHPEEDRVVIRVKVNVGKVTIINYQGHPLQKTWHDHGYDTAWVPPNCGMVKSGLEENCVWDPKRITILQLIKPTRVPAQNFARLQWAEDDFVLPAGVSRLLTPQPNDGQTYIMYHGTSTKFAQAILATGFRQSEDGMLGRGVYLSRDLEKASRYPIDHPEEDRVVIRVKVNVGKVTIINYQGHPLQKTWHDHGYDTAWVPPNCGMTKSGLEENCVWDPKRITILKIIKPTCVPDQTTAGSSYGYK
ncbi:grass carp reovirus (GCRV)-induced gene 2e [Cyprinodon tularosa]|uniref:grass carp reovirus (GCRV)-induced gene 2e n=1 Tax=Cyprinodon tularosa TaxID=77115 RepID=UPI0018E1DBA8|nr:grass carp reovirus (GCRV)-induced gene 2e [Cyprinodon tularosa]